MSYPIPPSSAFGKVKNDAYFASDFITRKKTLLAYCNAQSSVNCKKSWTQGEYLRYYNGLQITNNLCTPFYNTTNLEANLFTKENLYGVCTVANTSGSCGPLISTPVSLTTPFYWNYTIDPCGQLFGKENCSISNYTNYMVPGLQDSAPGVDDGGNAINDLYTYQSTKFTSSYNDVSFGYITEMNCSENGWVIVAPSVSEYNGSNYDAYGTVSISINAGETWIQYFPDASGSLTGHTGWSSCSCNSTGSIILVGAGISTNSASPPGSIYLSLNSGATWSNIYYPPTPAVGNYNAKNMSSSSTCLYNYVNFYNPNGGANGYIASFDLSGTILYTSPLISGINDIVTNSTGQYVFADTNGGSASSIYHSNNYGQSYNSANITNPPATNNWTGITCSNNGEYVYVCEATSGTIYYSNNYGLNYYLLTTLGNGLIPESIICSGSGNVVTVAGYGGVYQNTDVVSKLSETTPIPFSAWKLIGTSNQSPNSWLSVTADKNTGKNLVMSPVVNTYNCGGIWTYNDL
jgi:hypothetical protein